MRITGWHREDRRFSAALGWRQCAGCGEKKRLDAYYQDRHGGVREQCKACDGYRVKGVKA